MSRNPSKFGRTLLVALCCASGLASAAEADEQVAAATKEWISTFNTRDAARISALYAPDAVLWGTVSQTIRTTHEQILEYFEDSSRKRPNLRMELGEFHVQLYGDIATNSGYYASHNPIDGRDVVIPMRFTFMYRREGDRWFIVNHHSSRFAPTP
ncbi:MAG TPA: SgcJ/EcaC family oxidoreductase [Burkholderiales bacterium]|nr:SgcJ/EcaC family oxidoreductase [Burkholderiales bacterium]